MNNQQIMEEIKKEIKICIETNENEKNDNANPTGLSKSNANGKVHSNTRLPQETREKLKKNI